LTADLELFDSDVFQSSSSIAPFAGFNRIQIENTNSSSGSGYPTAENSDQVDYEADDDFSGIVRGYPSPWRNVKLIHTGLPSTEIVELNIVSRLETESVEFVAGLASVKFPVLSISAKEWNIADLGTVTFDGNKLKSSSDGYSMLNLTYVTEAYEWAVSGEDGSKVQFVML
jgi:hypothetical protein